MHAFMLYSSRHPFFTSLFGRAGHCVTVDVAGPIFSSFYTSLNFKSQLKIIKEDFIDSILFPRRGENGLSSITEEWLKNKFKFSLWE